MGGLRDAVSLLGRADARRKRYVEVECGCVPSGGVPQPQGARVNEAARDDSPAGARMACDGDACTSAGAAADGASDTEAAAGASTSAGDARTAQRPAAAGALAAFRSFYTSKDGWYAVYEDRQGHLTSVNTARFV